MKLTALVGKYDPYSRSVPIIASTTDSVDGEAITSWDLDRFAKNPTVLWAHDPDQLPLGRAKDVEFTGKDLRMRVYFGSERANPFAEQVALCCAEGLVRAVSVGYESKGDGHAILNEVSFVSIGLDENAGTPHIDPDHEINEDVMRKRISDAARALNLHRRRAMKLKAAGKSHMDAVAAFEEGVRLDWLFTKPDPKAAADTANKASEKAENASIAARAANGHAASHPSAANYREAINASKDAESAHRDASSAHAKAGNDATSEFHWNMADQHASDARGLRDQAAQAEKDGGGGGGGHSGQSRDEKGRFDYSEDQPRDDHGRFGAGGGAGTAGVGAAGAEKDYRPRFGPGENDQDDTRPPGWTNPYATPPDADRRLSEAEIAERNSKPDPVMENLKRLEAEGKIGPGRNPADDEQKYAKLASMVNKYIEEHPEAGKVPEDPHNVYDPDITESAGVTPQERAEIPAAGIREAASVERDPELRTNYSAQADRIVAHALARQKAQEEAFAAARSSTATPPAPSHMALKSTPGMPRASDEEIAKAIWGHVNKEIAAGRMDAKDEKTEALKLTKLVVHELTEIVERTDSMGLGEGEVLRFDRGARLGKVQRTPVGGAKIPSRLSRTGILKYMNPDGSCRRELRTEDEVFNKDSLESLEHAPVIDIKDHTGMVTPETWRKVSLGHVTTVRRDGQFMEGDLIVQDAETLDAVDSGERTEISLGYRCRLDMTSGVYNGEPYDCVQRNIRYNHAALCPPNRGRAGPEVGLRLDSNSPAWGITNITEEEDRNMKLIRLDGRDYEMGSDAHIAKIEELAAKKVDQVKLDAKTAIDSERQRADKLEGERDALKAEIEKFNTDAKRSKDDADKKKAEDEKDYKFKKKGRRALERMALRMFTSKDDGDDKEKMDAFEEKLDDMSDREIRLFCIEAGSENFDSKTVEGKNDDYVEARYDSVIERVKLAEPRARGITGIVHAAQDAQRRLDASDAGAGGKSDGVTGVVAAQRKRDENAANAWKPKTA